MCTLTAIDQTAEACPKAIGGIFALALADYNDLTAVTIAAGVVSAVTGITWVLFKHDIDGTAFFDQNGESPSPNLIDFISDGFVKFVDATPAKIAAVNGLVCCKLIGIAFMNNGTNRIFGFDPDLAGTSFIPSLEAHKVIPSVKSGTSNDENRVEYVIQGKSAQVLTTTITYASVDV